MMDNKIQALACMNRFKLSSKKVFTATWWQDIPVRLTFLLT